MERRFRSLRGDRELERMMRAAYDLRSTMLAPAIPATENAWLGLAPEVTAGTPVNPTIFSPLMDPAWVPKQTYLQDIGLRGDPTMDHDDVLGVRSATYGWKTNLFADIWPYYMLNLLGTDAVTGTTAPYTHTSGVINNTTGSQPPSLTLSYFDGGHGWQLPWSMLNKVDIAMAIDAAVEATMSAICLPAASASLSGNTYNTEHIIPSWDTAITLGTIVSTAVESFDCSIERLNSEPIHTAGQQNAHANYLGPIRVTGKMMFVYDNNDGIAPNVLTEALERLQQLLSVVFTDPVTSHSITLQMTTAQLEDPVVTAKKSWLEIETGFRAIGNSTDAVNGGTSPIKCITSNAQSAAA